MAVGSLQALNAETDECDCAETRKADFNLFPESLDGRNADHLEESLAFSVTDHYADDIQTCLSFPSNL